MTFVFKLNRVFWTIWVSFLFFFPSLSKYFREREHGTRTQTYWNFIWGVCSVSPLLYDSFTFFLREKKKKKSTERVRYRWYMWTVCAGFLESYVHFFFNILIFNFNIFDSFINYQWTWVIFVVGENRAHHLFHQQEPAKVPWVCFAATLFFVLFVFLSPWTYASSKREVALCNMEL